MKPVGKKRGMFVVALAGLLFAAGLVWPCQSQAYQGCVQVAGGVACPPVHGGIAVDSMGRAVCGPGMCVRDRVGNVICSNTPGGSAGVDSMGNVLCVGGCVRADAKYCVAGVRAR